MRELIRRLPRLRPSDVLRHLGRAYGAHPLHLLALVACFALAGYAGLRAAGPPLPRMLVWFALAVIVHDLVLFPLYALADRSLTGVLRRPRVSVINHVRVPSLGAGLLFLVYFPGIVRQGAATYMSATGRSQQPYLGRWLLLTAMMFALSAAVYAVRLARHRQWHRLRRRSPR